MVLAKINNVSVDKKHIIEALELVKRQKNNG